MLELAADVRAFLAQRVVKAYRTGAIVEMKLWVRRNRALASSLAAAVVILVAGIVGTSTFWIEASARAESLAIEAEKNRIFADVSKLAEAERLEAELYPAFPDKVAAMEAWLRDFGEPMAARLQELEAALVAVRARARPVTEEQRKAAREQHSRWPELQRRQEELTEEDDPAFRDWLEEQIVTIQNDIDCAGLECAETRSRPACAACVGTIAFIARPYRVAPVSASSSAPAHPAARMSASCAARLAS